MTDIKREIISYLGTLPPQERIILKTTPLQEVEGYFLYETTTYTIDSDGNELRLQIFVRHKEKVTGQGMLECDDKAKKLIKKLQDKFKIWDTSKFYLGTSNNFYTYSINFSTSENI